MGDDSLLLREDGYLRMNFPVTSLTYHSNLNKILVKNDSGSVHVLDVNSGVILQTTSLSSDDGGALGVEYVPGADRVFVWDSIGVGARTDYNGVLLLHTALQRPLPTAQPDKHIKIELVLSEAVLLYQCLQTLDALAIEGLTDFTNELKNVIEAVPAKKGVKAQKWITVTIELPQSILRMVTSSVVQELKVQNRRIPALSIASAVGHRANDLVPCSQDEESRALMYSEAERKETFKRWPHMDYKWARPARMAQAGFYHQPSPSGDDRAMCFTCKVCLVCWEKSDEPWVEHERHSPNCPFVRGEYTHNVPISVTNATACAVPSPNVTIVSKGNFGDLIATGTIEGKVNIWKFDCGLKLVKFIHLSPYDSIFSGILSTDCNKVWSASLEKDSSTYGIELTAMSFVGMTLQQEGYQQPQGENIEKETKVKTKPALICAVVVTRTTIPSDPPIKEEDASKVLFNAGDKSTETVQAMNVENDAKSNLTSNKMLFLLTYDIHSSLAGSVTTVVHTSNSSGNSKPGCKKVYNVARTDDAYIYDEIYVQYSDDDTELPQCTKNVLGDQISNVINLNASSSSKDLVTKFWEPKIIVTKHLKVLPPPTPPYNDVQGSMLDFACKMSQLKSWKSGNLETVGTKLADQTDATVLPSDITQYLNGPLEINGIIPKWYDGGDGTEKVKFETFGGSKTGTQTAVSNSNNDGFESDPPQEETVTQGIAIQCLHLPNNLNLTPDSKVTHIMPTEDKEHLLVVVSTIDPELIKKDHNKKYDTDKDGDVDMEIDELALPDLSVCEAYFLLYKLNDKTSTFTLEDRPASVKVLSYGESPVDLCLLPKDKHDQYSMAVVGIDGQLRLYSLPNFITVSERRAPKGNFTSLTYCASVERLSVSTKSGMIYFYALNNTEKDSSGNIDEEFSDLLNDIQWYMLPNKEEVSGQTTPVILANKQDLETAELETLVRLTGSYGNNSTLPYTAVVPGFWCELSPAQRARDDHLHNRTWRLQNTSSTWDEHVLELTCFAYRSSLSHIEFNFTLHTPCNNNNLPLIQVTLLKQNQHGIGYKKDATFGQRPDSPVRFPLIDSDVSSNLENPVNSEEYLQAHNAEILAGPVLLSSGLDQHQQSGTLLLTSPRLFRARGHTFLIHIKTLFDPAKDINKGSIKSGEGSSKKASTFIGCDWLHQISITVRSSPHTDMPVDVAKQQRIAMLESNSFLSSLFEIAVSRSDSNRRKLAMDLIIWVLSIRLQRLRVNTKTDKDSEKETDNPTETQQVECVKIVEKYTESMIKNCILCSRRSMAKKCIKIILITSEGAKQLPKPWKSTFDETLGRCVSDALPLLGACDSPGAMRWFVALAEHATARPDAATVLDKCMQLLDKTARCLSERDDVYHELLRARFGLYGLPFERSIFDVEGPAMGKSTSTPATYASVLSGDSGSAATTPKPECQLKDLFHLAGDLEGKIPPSQTAWWSSNAGMLALTGGLSEAVPLHVTCAAASDGTKLEASGAPHTPSLVAAEPALHPSIWSTAKDSNTKPSQPDSLEDGGTSSPMDCDPQDKTDSAEDKMYQYGGLDEAPWAQLVLPPPAHSLCVERMHSGARRYIVLDLGRLTAITDVIIPSCADLVTLCIDLWVRGEELDSVRLAFATDIASKHLALTDLQPPPVARYIKITTIGRYGMTAMKCKIPLGWFYGEVVDVNNVQNSVNSLNVLYQDLTCKFRLATGKLQDLLNPFLEHYNGPTPHMMAYLNKSQESDPKVLSSYQECIELQQQMHTCTNILKKLQNKSDSNSNVLELVLCGKLTAEKLLERASTDKLRVLAENLIDLMLHFIFQVGEVTQATERVSREWCGSVLRLASVVRGRCGGALAAGVARLAASSAWWGPLLAASAPASDRELILTMYMSRLTLLSGGGVGEALAARALAALDAHAQPAAAAASSSSTAAAAATAAAPDLPTALTMLAAALDPLDSERSRWEWVGGGRATFSGRAEGSSSSPASNLKLHRRKLHKKPIHDARHSEKQRSQFSLKSQLGIGRRWGTWGRGESTPPPRVIPVELARTLASKLVDYLLAADSGTPGDTLLLAAKTAGRVCVCGGGAGWLRADALRGVLRAAVSRAPWQRHALTALLQDLVEFEHGTSNTSPESAEWPSGSQLGKAPKKRAPRMATLLAGGSDGSSPIKLAILQDVLAESAMAKEGSSSATKAKSLARLNALRGDLVGDWLVSDESEGEDKSENSDRSKEDRPKQSSDTDTSNISWCVDARVERCAAGGGELRARRLLLRAAAALPAALRAPHPAPAPAPAPSAAAPASSPGPAPPAGPRVPLAHTLYEAFRLLATDFLHQPDSSYMEAVISVWLAVNGCRATEGALGGAPAAAAAAAAAAGDAPRVRLASDTVRTHLHALRKLEHVSLRCWVLSMQALAWISSLPLQTEGSQQTMARVILECEHFVPAIVRFVRSDVSGDGCLSSSEPYLGGACIGVGVGAASSLQTLLSRVLGGRPPHAALAALRLVSGVWASEPGDAYDLQAALLRVAHPLLQSITDKHLPHAVSLIDNVASMCVSWMCGGGSSGGGGGGAWAGGGPAALGGGAAEPRLSALLADALGGRAGRRAPPRAHVRRLLLHYARRALLAHTHTQEQSQAGASTSGESSSQTDESKAERTESNLDDERKQRAPPQHRLAHIILQHPEIMKKFYRALSMCDGVNTQTVSSGTRQLAKMPEPAGVTWPRTVVWSASWERSISSSGLGQANERTDGGMTLETGDVAYSLKEEVYWLVAQIVDPVSDVDLVINSLLDYLRSSQSLSLSWGMARLVLTCLSSRGAAATFAARGGVQLAAANMAAHHQAGPSTRQGPATSLVNLVRANSKPMASDAQPALINLAPMCTVSCTNPTAQPADVLLGEAGGAGGGGGGGAAGAGAARRVRAAAWSYHFFSAEDAALALTLRLPHVAALHELHLQPHLTQLATCPGAVGVEAGCEGALAPLGAPLCTAGMTFIRLVFPAPVLADTLLIRLYKPRDSSNMGLLQLRVLGTLAFSKGQNVGATTNRWVSLLGACVGSPLPLPAAAWSALSGAGSVAALVSLAGGGGGAGVAAVRVLLAAAANAPHESATLLHALFDAHQTCESASSGGWSRRLLGASRALVLGAPRAAAALPGWLAAQRDRAPNPHALYNAAAILWTLKEEKLLDNADLEELVTDELFDLMYDWVTKVPQYSFLKKSIDSVMCSMCFIRPELYRRLLEYIGEPIEDNCDSMCCTDDSKASLAARSGAGPTGLGAGGAGAGAGADIGRARCAWGGAALRSAALCALSPPAAHTLLRARPPAAAVASLTEFSIAKLREIQAEANASQEDVHMSESDKPSTSEEDMSAAECTVSLKEACDIVEWLLVVVQERSVKSWLGAAGAAFWAPLLHLLCYPRLEHSGTWHESSLLSRLEEQAVRLFGELTSCHRDNEKLFANTLHHIIAQLPDDGPEGLSGFTRSLILRLVLSPERVRVCVSWAGGSGAGGAGAGAAGSGRGAVAGACPPHPATAGRGVLSLPAHTPLYQMPIAHPDPDSVSSSDDSSVSGWSGAGPSGSPAGAGGAAGAGAGPGAGGVARGEPWELSLAAGSVSRDKRAKDARNHTLRHTRPPPSNSESGQCQFRVSVPGVEGFVPLSTRLKQLAGSRRDPSPFLTLTLHPPSNDSSPSEWSSPGSPGGSSSSGAEWGGVLAEFGACGGLALVAARLPPPRAPPPAPLAAAHHQNMHWIKIDDHLEEVVEEGPAVGSVGAGGAGEAGYWSVPGHALPALARLLKLPGYPAALLRAGPPALALLTLLLGVPADTDPGSPMSASSSESGSLGTLPFTVLSSLLETSAGEGGEEGRVLRRALLAGGAAALLLRCLAALQHHKPENSSGGSSKPSSKESDKCQLYWAKGTGFGTGSTQQAWNVEQALLRQRTEEQHCTALLQVFASYMNPNEVWPPGDPSPEPAASPPTASEPSVELCDEFVDLVADSALIPTIASYLRNDSVLDMSRHVPLYVCVLRVARGALRGPPRLRRAARALPPLLRQMCRTAHAYHATTGRMNKTKSMSKMTLNQRFSSSSNSEHSDEDEGLAALIADIQATAELVGGAGEAEPALPPPPPLGATREARYVEVMRRLQFQTFEMIEECGENEFRFTVPYHFESMVRAAGACSHPARIKRLAQECATLATSLPLSPSSSVFVRLDQDRLDVMKVLITGPMDTPYANGCFVLDVYFPAEYPAAPMLINLETTGRHSVRFNPNLYNDGKVCLSVLNTWHGRPEEKWNAHTSSFLQVLVSIQSLILVPEPYFNEPGYERSRGTRVGAAASLEYNSNIYQAAVRWAMLDHLRNPTPPFKEVIQTHFWLKRNEIMSCVASWISELEAAPPDDRTQRSLTLNLCALKRHYVRIGEELAKLPCPPGLEDLDEPFQLPAAPAGSAPAAQPAPALTPPAPSPVPAPAPAPAPAAPTSGDTDIDTDMEKIVQHVLD